MKESKRVFKITFQQIKKRRLVFGAIGCILLSFLLVFGIRYQKDSKKELLFPNPDSVHEKLEMITLEAATKYNIIYTIDERIPSLKEYALLKMEQDSETDEEKRKELEEELNDLDIYLSSTIQERAQKEMTKHEDKLKELRKEVGSVPISNVSESLRNSIYQEEFYVKYYKEFLSDDITLYSPHYVLASRILYLFEESLIPSKTEAEFKREESLSTKYNNYEEYLTEYKEHKTVIEAELNYLDDYLAGSYPYPSSMEWKNNYVYTAHDGFFTVFLYSLIVVTIFVLTMTSLFYKDYKNGTISQFRIHVSTSSYLKGKLLACFLLLSFYLLIGYILIPLISYITSPDTMGHFTILNFFTNNCIRSTYCSFNDNFILFLIPIFIHHLFIGLTSILLISELSLLKPPRPIIYIVSILVISITIFLGPLYNITKLGILSFIPMTYFNYYSLLESQNLFIPRQILFQSIILIIIYIILKKIQTKQINKL